METKFEDGIAKIREEYSGRTVAGERNPFDAIELQHEEMTNLLGNIGESHTSKGNSNFRRTSATPPPESYSMFDEFELVKDQFLFSTTNPFNDKDLGMFERILLTMM